MRAYYFERYGGPEVLHQKDINKPSPKADEVLIKVHATTVTAGDWRMRKADPFLARIYNGLFRPNRIRVLGFELAGVVEEAGNEVTRFKPGDSVFGYSHLQFGGYAEYKSLSEKLVEFKPKNIDMKEAAALAIGAGTAINFLKKGNIKDRTRVLIYGALGSVGSYAVQLAKYYCAEASAVASTRNRDLLRDIGADYSHDYTNPNFKLESDRYDLIFDAGTLKEIHDIVEEGYLKPVIDRIYSFDQIPEAHGYVESFRKKGNVVVEVLH